MSEGIEARLTCLEKALARLEASQAKVNAVLFRKEGEAPFMADARTMAILRERSADYVTKVILGGEVESAGGEGSG